jgi:hypothetical protein
MAFNFAFFPISLHFTSLYVNILVVHSVPPEFRLIFCSTNNSDLGPNFDPEPERHWSFKPSTGEESMSSTRKGKVKQENTLNEQQDLVQNERGTIGFVTM